MSGVDEHATLRAVVASGRPETLSEEQIERLLAHAGDCTDCSAELYEFAATAILARDSIDGADEAEPAPAPA